MDPRRLLIFGLDAGTWTVIDPLIEAGRLPTLAHLRARGAWGTLASTQPPITPTAWTTFFTGKNPGKHGIFDFQRLDPQTYRLEPVQGHRHRHRPFWELLNEAGRRTVLIDLPFTYPPGPLEGIWISGYGTPRRGRHPFVWPPDFPETLPGDLRARFRLAVPTHAFDRSPAFLREWTEILEDRRRLLLHLWARDDWDLFLVVLSVTDNAAHVLWTYLEPKHPNYAHPEAPALREAFLGFYETCDRILGELLERLPADGAVLVMSDHGFGSVFPRQLTWQLLARQGYIRYRGKGARRRLIEGLLALYTRFPWLKEQLKGLRPGRRRRLRQALLRGGMSPSLAGVDLEGSRVLPSNFGLQIWIHDRDRFARGPVPPEAADELIEALARDLLAARDPVRGWPVFAAAHRGRDLFHGEGAALAPDLVLEHVDHYPVPRKGRNGLLEGGHTVQGILLAYGAGIRPGQVDGGLADVTATLLYLLDAPLPPDLDGRVLEGLIDPALLRRRPPRQGEKPAVREGAGTEGYTEEEEGEVREQLRQLGYL